MIHYDSHNWLTLVRFHGSVFPKALKLSAGSAALAVVLKYLEANGTFNPTSMTMTDQVAYSGFTFTLGFVLAFRTSQCYSRFCECSTSVCILRSQYFEAASTIACLTEMSKRPRHEIQEFKHKLIRLFSMLHAAAMEAIAELPDENFRVIDITGVPPEHINALQNVALRTKAELIYQWISCLMVRHIDDGLLNAPPPILTRVFQELERAMIAYKQVLQVKDVPFPFPYAQVTVCLIILHLFVTPFVMVGSTGHAAAAGSFTFVSCFCLLSIELIATQLEDPFGADANDLPCHRFQDSLNHDLLLLLNPQSLMPFYLLPQAKRDYNELVGDVTRREPESLGCESLPLEVPEIFRGGHRLIDTLSDICLESASSGRLSTTSNVVRSQKSANDELPQARALGSCLSMEVGCGSRRADAMMPAGISQDIHLSQDDAFDDELPRVPSEVSPDGPRGEQQHRGVSAKAPDTVVPVDGALLGADSCASAADQLCGASDCFQQASSRHRCPVEADEFDELEGCGVGDGHTELVAL